MLISVQRLCHCSAGTHQGREDEIRYRAGVGMIEHGLWLGFDSPVLSLDLMCRKNYPRKMRQRGCFSFFKSGISIVLIHSEGGKNIYHH